MENHLEYCNETFCRVRLRYLALFEVTTDPLASMACFWCLLKVGHFASANYFYTLSHYWLKEFLRAVILA